MRAFGRQVAKDPDKVARKLLESAPPADREVMEDPAMFAIHRQVTVEAMASPAAFAQEARMLAREWDADVEAIRAPVALWVGERDTTHPPVMARRLAAWLGDAPVKVVPEAGTFAMLPVYGDALAFARGDAA
jgi:pimeloyl-ACP methyl ester carboxylesterase